MQLHLHVNYDTKDVSDIKATLKQKTISYFLEKTSQC